MKKKLFARAIFGLAVVVLFSGCGSTGPAPATSPPPSTTTPVTTPPLTTPPATTPPATTPPATTPPATTPPVTTPPATTPPATTPPAKTQGPYDVWIQGFSFNPPVLTVPVGTVVTWTNMDADMHDVTGDFPDGHFTQQITGSGGTLTYKFTKAGTYNYVCSIHAGMSGKIIVQ
jgi:plastocyanin